MVRPDHPVLADLSTPCLVADGAALQRNIDTMAALARSAGVQLRPHAKTHKSPEIAARQVKAGAVGIGCATVAEAEMLAIADFWADADNATDERSRLCARGQAQL